MKATRAEIRDALQSLSAADHVRLEKYASFRAAGGRYTWEDLLHEAVSAALEEGRRRWDPSNVDFKGFLMGAMRSISSHWAEQEEKRATRLDSELQFDE